jgi:transcriptional regulator
MHIPGAYAVTCPDRLHAFIRSHSFATLVSADETTEHPPIATHLPLLLSVSPAQPIRLLGHVARGNSQWRHAEGRRVLAIFSGPHAYISAGWYGEQNVVPTWNYVAVHVTGILRIEQDPDWLLEHVRTVVETYEQNSPNPWSLDTVDVEFQRCLVAGIVGLSIQVEDIQGCWKLSQHHSEARRQGAISGLQQRALGDDLEIAGLMDA